jgi:hypothetical protein
MWTDTGAGLMARSILDRLDGEDVLDSPYFLILTVELLFDNKFIQNAH